MSLYAVDLGAGITDSFLVLSVDGSSGGSIEILDAGSFSTVSLMIFVSICSSWVGGACSNSSNSDGF